MVSVLAVKDFLLHCLLPQYFLFVLIRFVAVQVESKQQ